MAGWPTTGRAPSATAPGSLTGLLALTGWPKGMRVIVARNARTRVAQLRFTDADGLRVTAFATSTSRAQADLEVRHRWRNQASGPAPAGAAPWARYALRLPGLG